MSFPTLSSLAAPSIDPRLFAHGFNARMYLADYVANGVYAPTSSTGAFVYVSPIKGDLENLMRGNIETFDVKLFEGTEAVAEFIKGEKAGWEFESPNANLSLHALGIGRGGATPLSSTTDEVVDSGTAPNITHSLEVGGFTKSKLTNYQALIAYPGPDGALQAFLLWNATVKITNGVKVGQGDIVGSKLVVRGLYDVSAVTAGKHGLGELYVGGQSV